MGKKAVFFDIDGTLYDFRNGVCDSTREAIRRLKANGHYAFICTGRTMATIFDPELLSMDFDGLVAGCGTYVVKDDKQLLNYEISLEKLHRALRVFRAYRMDPVLEGEHFLYYRRQDYLVGKKDAFMEALDQAIPERLVEIEDHMEDMHVNKLCVRCEDEELAKEGLGLLEEDYALVKTDGLHRELIPVGYSKATGMKKMCGHLGIDRVDTYAFGDSANDLDMLKYAGCGIAMGNASRITRETADYVTRGIDEDGLYLGLKEFGLI